MIVSSTRRLADEDRLEAALQGGVLLDVLAVLVERRRADGLQLAAGQHRLHHVGGVHRALGGAGADHGVQLVDEQHHVLARMISSSTPLSRSSNSPRYLAPATMPPEVEGEHALAAQRLGHLAVDDLLGQPLGDRRLAHAGLADQDGVVLGAPAQDLDDPLDLLVPADDRVELVVAGQRRSGRACTS